MASRCLLAAVFAVTCVPDGHAEEFAERPEVVEIGVRFERIIQCYKHRISSLLREQAPRTALRAAAKLRDDALSELVDAAGRIPLAELTADDKAALSIACEYLRRREECLHWGQDAISQNPALEASYAPVIRTLLNENRPEDAAGILQRASCHLPETSSVFSLHYFLYHRYRWNDDHSSACEHFRIFMRSQAASLAGADGLAAAETISLRLDEFQSAHEAAKREADAEVVLSKCLRNARTALAIMRRRSERAAESTEDQRAIIERLERVEGELEAVMAIATPDGSRSP